MSKKGALGEGVHARVFELGHLLELATHGPFQGSGFKILVEFHPENISLRLKSKNHAIILISISVT